MKNFFALTLKIFGLAVLIVANQNCAKPPSESNPNKGCAYLEAIPQSSDPLSTSGPVSIRSTGPLALFGSETWGGGDFGYQIKDSGTTYTVEVTHYNFTQYNPNQKSFVVSKAALESEVSRLEGEEDILNLMSGSCEILERNEMPYDSCGLSVTMALTGSWTHQFVAEIGSQSQIMISGFQKCSKPVDESKIRSFILEKLQLEKVD